MTSLALACRLGAVTAPRSIPRRVRAILNRYNATMLLPGVSGALRFGYQPGNYRESTGQTLAATDQQVGLVVDAAGTVGENITPNSLQGFNTIFGGGSLLSNNSFSSVSAGGVQKALLTVNKTYEITGSFSQTNFVEFSINNSAGLKGNTAFQSNSTSGTIKSVFKAVVPELYFRLAGTSTVTCEFSIRELPGIHASQSTSGFQPVLRRGLVNLLTYSADFLNAAWSAQGGAAKTSSTTVSLPVANSRVTQAGPVGSSSPGRVWTSAWLLSGTGTVSLFMYDDGGAYPGNSSQQITLTDTPTLYVHTRTHSDATATKVAVQVATASGGVTLVSGGAALFQGTVTAQEIIAAGGIPVTTSAPASSANGIQSWQFDGTDDRLSLSAVPFQMADDHFVVAGVNVGSSASDRQLLSVSSTSANNPVIALEVRASGVPRIWWRDDAGTFAERPATDGLSVFGNNVVLSGVKVGTSGRVRKNGTAQGTVSVALGTSTFNTATVGALTRSTVIGFVGGHIHGIIFGKGAITDSELMTLERFIASLQGRTL